MQSDMKPPLEPPPSSSFIAPFTCIRLNGAA
jgi:hypothetical protein